ncbi:MAG: class I SAM-dependent methyltransferase [SAR324 cluster bacterium]|nr:class I SAM-dependent methyltransferase [SAR324 cluster bacterium]
MLIEEESFIRFNQNICPFCDSKSSEIHLKTLDQLHDSGLVFNLIKCNHCYGVFLDGSCFHTLNDYYKYAYHDSYYTGKMLSTDQNIPFLKWHPLDVVFNHKTNVSCLDIGSGGGAFLKYMQNRGHQVTGIEFDKDSASRISKKLNCQIYSGSIDQIEIESKFDLITMWDVLEHFIDPQHTLKRIKTLLKDNGRIVLGVPNFDSFEAKLLRSSWFGLEAPRHIIQCTPHHLKLLIEKSNYSIITLKKLRRSSYFKKSFIDQRLICQNNRLSNNTLTLIQYLLRLLGNSAYLVCVIEPI